MKTQLVLSNLILLRVCTSKMSALQLSLTEKIRKATALLPPAHLVLLCEKKDVFATQAEAKTRYQNWAFTQGFAVVVEKNNHKPFHEEELVMLQQLHPRYMNKFLQFQHLVYFFCIKIGDLPAASLTPLDPLSSIQAPTSFFFLQVSVIF